MPPRGDMVARWIQKCAEAQFSGALTHKFGISWSSCKALKLRTLLPALRIVRTRKPKMFAQRTAFVVRTE